MRGHAPDGASHGAAAGVALDPRAILTSIGEVVYDWDIASDRISWGVNAGDVLGLDDLSTLSSGRDLALLTEPGSGATRHEAIVSSAATDGGSGVAYRTRYALRLPPNRLVAVEDSGRWFSDADGRPAFAHGVIRIDRAGSRSGTTTHGAYDDDGRGGLFGDRSEFLGQIKGDVAETARGKRSMTLVVAAIQDLARLNDEFGSDEVDGIIAEVTSRIRTVMRRRDKLVRYSGNRFALALLSCPSEQADTAIARLASLIQSEPVATAKGPVPVRLCIGAAAAPQHATDAPGLLRRAEEAMAIAKRGDRGPVVLYDAALTRDTDRRACVALPVDVIDALNTRRIVCARQPIVDARTRAVAFSEALLRIRTPDGRVVNAGDVVPAIERAGLVSLIDGRMLEMTADYLHAHPDERMAINVSPLTVEGSDWLGTLAAHVGARPGIASRLIIEVTETAAVRDPHATRARLDAMKALGVAIAIDDFGAGHTSFKHLRSFPIDILKIDGAFVQNLARSGDDRFFVRTLVDLAHHLNITTVAEWVEDEDTARTLTEWGIDFLQGDHCGAPVLVEDEGGAAPSAAVA
jgi:diguanylate cyclase (GGDEF)-like protein